MLSLAAPPPEPPGTWVSSRLRVMSNNKVLVSMGYLQDLYCCTGYLTEYDTLGRNDGGADRCRHRRADREPGAAGTGAGRSRMLLLNPCCVPFGGDGYTTATDSFVHQDEPGWRGPPSSGRPTSREAAISLGARVLNSSLGTITTLDQPLYHFGPTRCCLRWCHGVPGGG